MLQEITARTPKAIITKALYSKLLGLKRNDSEADLGADYLSEDLNHLLNRFILYYGQPAGLSRVEDFKLLRQEFAIALRHRTDQYELCAEVARQALEKGIPYVTFGVSPAARALKQACKEVVVEVNRAKSLSFKSHPQSHSLYWADFDILHDTADLILKYFAKRYPLRILAIYSRRQVHWLKNEQVYSEDVRDFKLSDIDPNLEERSYWQIAR